MEKVVLRFSDGMVVKGYLKVFSETGDFVEIEDLSGNSRVAEIDKLKALFFVKSFEGMPHYNERKLFLGLNRRYKKVFVKFKDGESMTGYIEGDIPWGKGFFLERSKKKGFYLLPTDNESNNIKVFVVTSSVKDVTLIG